MKYLNFFLLIASCLVFFSCSKSPENTIVTYLERTKGIDAKLYDFKEVRDVTVKDSLEILQREAQEKIQMKIDSCNEVVDAYKKELADGAKTILQTPVLAEAYAKAIIQVENSIDSLSKITPRISTIYEGRDLDEVIAVVYSGRIQSKKKNITYFTLSPDKEVCYAMETETLVQK